jgi:hypothetical protein
MVIPSLLESLYSLTYIKLSIFQIIDPIYVTDRHIIRSYIFIFSFFKKVPKLNWFKIGQLLYNRPPIPSLMRRTL